MPKFIRLTLPAAGYLPERPTAVNAAHIVTVSPRYITHQEDKLRPISERRVLVEGTWVETLANVGAEESSTLHVVEGFENVMSAIHYAN